MICLCATTRRAARLLTHLYEEALRPANLTAAQFELLATLAKRPAISQSTLAQALALDQTTLSRNLKPLLTRSLIHRTRSSRDRRQFTYTLTPTGHEALAKAMPLWQKTHMQMQHRLADQWPPTLNTLSQITAAASSSLSKEAVLLQGELDGVRGSTRDK